MTRKVVVYIAASVDGYIAGEGDDLGFLEMATKEGEDYGYADFMKTVDTVILGRRTFDWLMRMNVFAYPGKEVFVVTNQNLESIEGMQYFCGEPQKLIAQLQEKPGRNIFCDGGASLIHSLLCENLVDELTISYLPVLLGKGIPLFSSGREKTLLQFVSAKTFDTGLLQIHYKVLK